MQRISYNLNLYAFSSRLSALWWDGGDTVMLDGARENKEKQARIDYLKQKEEERLRDFKKDEENIVEMWTSEGRKKRFREWYEECRERVMHGDAEIPTYRHVILYMRKQLVRWEIFSAATHLYKILPEEGHKDYEDSIKTQLKQAGATISVSIEGEHAADGSSLNTLALSNDNAKSYKEEQEDKPDFALEKSIVEFDHYEAKMYDEYLRKKAERLKSGQQNIRDQQQELAKLAEKNKWTDINIKLKSTSADRPDPRQGPYWEMLLAMSEAIKNFAEKVRRFPPDPEDERRYVLATYPYYQLVMSLEDDKWAQSRLAWMETIKTMEASHKHAAAVLHGTNARIKEFYEDEESGQTKFRWVEIPRNFTREQVGDQREGILELAIDIIKSEGAFYCMAECKDKYAMPFLAGRRVKMHEEFSDKAFSGGGNLS